MKISTTDSDKSNDTFSETEKVECAVEILRKADTSGSVTMEFEHADESLLLVGIYKNKYLLTILTPDGEAYDCASQDGQEGEVVIVLGGQPTPWDRSLLVDLSTAQEALVQFMGDGMAAVWDKMWKRQF